MTIKRRKTPIIPAATTNHMINTKKPVPAPKPPRLTNNLTMAGVDGVYEVPNTPPPSPSPGNNVTDPVNTVNGPLKPDSMMAPVLEQAATTNAEGDNDDTMQMPSVETSTGDASTVDSDTMKLAVTNAISNVASAKVSALQHNSSSQAIGLWSLHKQVDRVDIANVIKE